MITLPAQPRAAHLRAFWFALCALIGLGTGIFLIFVDVHHGLAIWTISIVFLLLSGMVAPDRVQRFYLMWNRGARFVSREISRILMAVCFFIIVAAVGLAGARFARKVPEPVSSGWQRRGPERQDDNLPSFPGQANEKAEWVRAYMHWTRRSSNLWALVLLPFLMLLSLVSKVEDDAPPTHVYTLF
jgi:hypothetical protein